MAYGIRPEFAVLAGYNVEIVRLKTVCNSLITILRQYRANK